MSLVNVKGQSVFEVMFGGMIACSYVRVTVWRTGGLWPATTMIAWSDKNPMANTTRNAIKNEAGFAKECLVVAFSFALMITVLPICPPK